MKKIIIVIFALCLFNSCDDEIIDLSFDESNSSQMKSSSEKFVWKFYTVTDEDFDAFVPCNKNEEHWYQTGESIIPSTSRFGAFDTKMNFCMDNFLDGPSLDGEDEDGVPYAYYSYRVVKGYFLFEDGDRLNFIVPKGEVRLGYGGEGFVMWWDDTFIFTGGTGKFKGASGRGTTMANSTDGVINNHNWTGMIKLVK